MVAQVRFSGAPMKPRAILTDSHFLIPLAVFLFGVVLLVVMH